MDTAPARRSSSKGLSQGSRRQGLLDLKSFREIFPSGESRQHKRRKELVELYIEEAIPTESSKKRARKTSPPNVAPLPQRPATLGGLLPDEERSIRPPMVVSNVSGGMGRASAPSSLTTSAAALSRAGLRVPQPRGSRMRQYGWEQVEAAYSDVRVVANQLEDQLTRAFESRDSSGHGDVPMQVIREILQTNHFGMDEEELGHIMDKLVRQQSVIDGQVVDFRRFLTAVRPRVWSELMTKRIGNYQTPSLNHCPAITPSCLADPASLPALPTSRPGTLQSSSRSPTRGGASHPSTASSLYSGHRRPQLRPTTVEIDMSLLPGSDEAVSPSCVHPSSRAAKLLPALRMDQLTAAREVKKSNFTREMSRQTPHVLQHCTQSGRPRKEWSLLELKRELAVAEYGVKVLNQRVREDVAWVNEHCGAARTARARRICRAYGAEKMAKALGQCLSQCVRRRFQRWKDYYHFLVDRDYAQQYLRFKACHLLVVVLTGWLHRHYRRGLLPLRMEMERQRREERGQAAVTLQRHARGFNERARRSRELRSKAATRLQAATRGVLARRKSRELKEQLKRDKSARVIQAQLRRVSTKARLAQQQEEEEEARKREERRQQKKQAEEAEQKAREEEARAARMAKQKAQEDAKRKAEEVRLLKEKREQAAKEARRERAAAMAAAAKERREREAAEAEEEARRRAKEREEEEEAAHLAAARIQKLQRGKQARKQVGELRQEKQQRPASPPPPEQPPVEEAAVEEPTTTVAEPEPLQEEPVQVTVEQQQQQQQEEEQPPAKWRPPALVVDTGTSMVGDDVLMQGGVVRSPVPERTSILGKIMAFFSPRAAAGQHPQPSPSTAQSLISRGLSFLTALSPSSRRAALPNTPTSPGQSPAARFCAFISPGASPRHQPIEDSGPISASPTHFKSGATQAAPPPPPPLLAAPEPPISDAVESPAQPAEEPATPDATAAVAEAEAPPSEQEEAAPVVVAVEQDHDRVGPLRPSSAQGSARGAAGRRPLSPEGGKPKTPQSARQRPPGRPVSPDQARRLSSTGTVTQPASPAGDKRPGSATVRRPSAGPSPRPPSTPPPPSAEQQAAMTRRLSNTPDRPRTPTQADAAGKPTAGPPAVGSSRPSTADRARRTSATTPAQRMATTEMPRQQHKPAARSPSARVVADGARHGQEPAKEEVEEEEAAAAGGQVDIWQRPPTADGVRERPSTGGDSSSSSRPGTAEPATNVDHWVRPPTPTEARPTAPAKKPTDRPASPPRPVTPTTERRSSGHAHQPSPPPRPSASKPPPPAMAKPQPSPAMVASEPVPADAADSDPPTARPGTAEPVRPGTADGTYRPQPGARPFPMSETAGPTDGDLKDTVLGGRRNMTPQPRPAKQQEEEEVGFVIPSPTSQAAAASKPPAEKVKNAPPSPASAPRPSADKPHEQQQSQPEPAKVANRPLAEATSPPVKKNEGRSSAVAGSTPTSALTPAVQHKPEQQQQAEAAVAKEAEKRPSLNVPTEQQPPVVVLRKNDDAQPATPPAFKKPSADLSNVAASLKPLPANAPGAGDNTVVVMRMQEQAAPPSLSPSPQPPSPSSISTLAGPATSQKPTVSAGPPDIPATDRRPSTAPPTDTQQLAGTLSATSSLLPRPTTADERMKTTTSGFFSTFFGRTKPVGEDGGENGSRPPTAEEKARKAEENKAKKKAQEEEERRRKEEEKAEKKRLAEEEKARRAEEKKEREKAAEEERKAKKAKEEEDKAEKKRQTEEEKQLRKEQEEEEKKEEAARREEEEKARAKAAAEERRARKELKATQLRMALRLQRVFRGFRVRRRMAAKRSRVREVEVRAAAVIVKATIRVQALVRSRLARNYVRNSAGELLKRKEEGMRRREERLAEEKRRKEQEEKDKAMAEAGAVVRRSVVMEVTPEVEERLQKLAKLEEMEKQLKEREAALKQAEERLVATQATSAAVVVQQQGGGDGGAMVAYTPAEAGGGQLSEWIEYWDDEAQSYYYYNPITQEASWTPPQELSVVSSSGSDPYDYSSVASYAGDGSLASAAEGWIEEWDEVNSRSYWVNVNTGEASWTNPALPAAEYDQQALASYENSKESWVSYIDETTGQEYWYNSVTGETSWEPPVV